MVFAPQNIIKFLLYSKNISFLDNKKNFSHLRRKKKTLESKKFRVRCLLEVKRWNYMQPTLLQQLQGLLKIFSVTWNLCSITHGVQKAEVKVKTKRDKISEQQFNELPAILLLISKTFEHINTKNNGLMKFTHELFLKNKTIKTWIKKYKLITYVSKTAFWGESVITHFFSKLGKILFKFPKVFFRKTKLLKKKH